jgi:branched-chain amino acid transport system substrate-binding protein
VTTTPRRTGGARLALAAVLALCPPAARAEEPELVFGMSAPLSGPAQDLGREVRAGVQAAFAAQNDAGGVHGRKLRLVAVDDGFEPARTAAATKDLVYARKVFGFVGSVGTAGAEVTLPVANEKGLLFFGAVSGASFLRNNPPDRYVFNLRASYAEETAAILRYLVEVRKIAPARIAVFAQDDAFGEAGFEGVARMMRHYRQDPAKVLRVGYRRNTADVEAAVKAIASHAKDVGAVVMVATYKAAARFIERLRDAKVRGLVLTNVSDVGANALAEELAQLGPGYGDGVIVTQVVPPPGGKEAPLEAYREQLRRYAPGERPGFLSLEGWLAARLLVEGLQRAGKNAGVEAVVEALEHVQGLDLGLGTPVGFGPSEHQASHAVWGTVIDAKGQLQPLALP